MLCHMLIANTSCLVAEYRSEGTRLLWDLNYEKDAKVDTNEVITIEKV